MSEKGYSKSRRASPGKRTRQDNGPAVFAITAATPPTPAEVGPGHEYWQAMKEGGARALIAATHEAARLSAKFGEPIDPKWCLATPFLYELAAANRERAKYALGWRPRFLSILALTRSTIFACKGARVSRPTVDLHRKQDADFDAQVIAAQDHCVELLHDAAMMRALEGVVEPVFWQGIEVGHVAKYDNRLTVELLRAHMPRMFKTPGHGPAVTVNAHAGAGGMIATNIVVDEATRDELVALRQEALAQIERGMRTLGPGEAREVPPT